MRRKRRKNVISVPVASMGDIAFLLIIFFLVACRLAQDKKITPPASVDAAEMKESQISVLIDEAGIFYVNGQRVEDVKAVKAEVKTMLDRRNATNIVQRTVMFKCDASITKPKFEPVLEAIAEAGGIIGAVGKQGEPPDTESP